MEIEQPYFDKNGKEINEFALIKVFHFIGIRRKKYYMYKWIRLVETNGVLYWVGQSLEDDSGHYYHLRTYANKERVLTDSEVIQQRDEVKIF